MNGLWATNPTLFDHVFFSESGNFLVADHDTSAGIAVKLADAQGQRALAASGKTHQGQMLARLLTIC